MKLLFRCSIEADHSAVPICHPVGRRAQRRSRRAVGPRAMARLVLDRGEHAGTLTQIEGGHFAAGQPTRYLPQSLLLLSRRGCRVRAYDLNDLEPFEFRVRNRERPTGSRIAMGGAKRF